MKKVLCVLAAGAVLVLAAPASAATRGDGAPKGHAAFTLAVYGVWRRATRELP